MIGHVVAEVTDNGVISPIKLKDFLHIRLEDVAVIAGVSRDILRKNPASPKIQGNLSDTVRALELAEKLTGDYGKAISWFKFSPIDAYNGQTAQELVMQGHAAAVLKHLRRLENAGFA